MPCVAQRLTPSAYRRVHLELAVPLLVEALKDSAVSVNAVNALANFGTNALVAFPLLTNLVEHGDTNVAGAALRTLIIIAPDQAFPIFTNCLAQGKPKIDAAFKALIEVMPDKALPILLLARLQSPDITTTEQGIWLVAPLSDDLTNRYQRFKSSLWVPIPLRSSRKKTS